MADDRRFGFLGSIAASGARAATAQREKKTKKKLLTDFHYKNINFFRYENRFRWSVEACIGRARRSSVTHRQSSPLELQIWSMSPLNKLLWPKAESIKCSSNHSARYCLMLKINFLFLFPRKTSQGFPCSHGGVKSEERPVVFLPFACVDRVSVVVTGSFFPFFFFLVVFRGHFELQTSLLTAKVQLDAASSCKLRAKPSSSICQ